MQRSRLAWVELALWLGLSAAYVPLTRSMQPSLLMTVLAVGILMVSAKLLLVYGFFVWRRTTGAARFVQLGLAALVAGVSAALLIRLLYIWLYPEVTPLGLAFNIASDTAWAGVHALAIGLLLRFLDRRWHG